VEKKMPAITTTREKTGRKKEEGWQICELKKEQRACRSTSPGKGKNECSKRNHQDRTLRRQKREPRSLRNTAAAVGEREDGWGKDEPKHRAVKPKKKKRCNAAGVLTSAHAKKDRKKKKKVVLEPC